MRNRLKGKPVVAAVHTKNKEMIGVVSKRGTFIGRFVTPSKNTIDYYSINFGNKEWE
jgi:hypothetical protein